MLSTLDKKKELSINSCGVFLLGPAIFKIILLAHMQTVTLQCSWPNPFMPLKRSGTTSLSRPVWEEPRISGKIDNMVQPWEAGDLQRVPAVSTTPSIMVQESRGAEQQRGKRVPQNQEPPGLWPDLGVPKGRQIGECFYSGPFLRGHWRSGLGL